jgi:hypothetical protein
MAQIWLIYFVILQHDFNQELCEDDMCNELPHDDDVLYKTDCTKKFEQVRSIFYVTHCMMTCVDKFVCFI